MKLYIYPICFLSFIFLLFQFFLDKNIALANISETVTCYDTWSSGGDQTITQCYGCTSKVGALEATDQSTCTR